MAWLAWLILALAPVHGMPRGAAGDALQGVSASSVVHHGGHAMPDQPGCCGEPGHDLHGSMGSAHCAAVCGNVLPAAAMAGLVPAAPEPLHVSPSVAAAPSVVHAAPLRPPAG